MFIAGWFEGSLVTGTGLWLLSGLLGGLAWSLGWSSSRAAWRRSAATVVAWVITISPPIALVAMGHPLIAWGNILPGMAWAGVIASIIAPAIFMWLYTKEPWPLKTMVWLFFPFAGVVVAAGVHAYKPTDKRFLGDMVAVSTNWGEAKGEYEILERAERIGRTNERLAKEAKVKVVIYPEAILQRYEPALYPVLKMEIIDPAAQAGQTILLGTDLPTKDGNLQSAAIAFYPDGTTATAIARQPIPIALWKPWQSTGSFLSDWNSVNTITLSEGVRARVIFCYEEYIPLLSLINEARDTHNLVVIMANTWAANDALASAVQAQHSLGIARLFAKPLLRAENRPKKDAQN